MIAIDNAQERLKAAQKVQRSAFPSAYADHEPEEWKTDLPIRSPVPLLLILTGLQVLTAGFLVVYWFMPAGSFSSTATTSYSSGYPTAPRATSSGTPSTRKW